MPQTSFALMTTLGRSKEAAALANATTIQITQIAIGDGATVPSGGETSLYNEVDRFPIAAHGVVVGATNVAYFDAFLAAEDGPYTIREAGLYDSAGDLIAIAHYNPPISKPTPDSGQTVEATVRLEVAFSNVANITIVVDPSMQVALQRLSRLPWIPVISMTTTTPPTSPAVGDCYLIPASATGAWSGHTGKIAERTVSGWALITPSDGHGVGLPGGEVFVREAGIYQPAVITTAVIKTVFGVGADFADFNAANQWLSKRRIAASGSVTLSVSANQKITTSVQRLYHPDGQRITVAGAALTGGGYPSLSAFAGAGNSAPTRAADKVTNLAMLRSRFPTEIRSQGVAGQAFVFSNIGYVQDILFTCDDVAGDLFYLFGGATRLTRVATVGALGRSLVTRGILMALNNVCAVGAGTRGISLEDSSGGALTGGTISAWNCGGDGLAVSAGSVLAAEAGASMGAAGNGLAGMSASLGGKVNVNPSLGFARNGKYGFLARSGGHIYAIGCESAGNTDYGFFSEDSSFIDATNTLGANGLSGYAARNSSFIIATGGTAGTLAPVANTNGNGNSYIRV